MDIMMQAKVSKAVATHSEHSYAQAYNAGKLYIALSLTSTDKGVAITGKETLEKLQREFFALDTKDLEAIKKAVDEVVKSLPPEIDFSIALATPVEETFYIITAGESFVLLFRNGQVVTIGQGEEKQIIGYSGELLPGDTISLLTKDFLKTVPFQKISQALSEKEAENAVETLAPLLIERSTGGEAALILSLPSNTLSEKIVASEESQDKQEPIQENASKKLSVPKIPFPHINIVNLKQLSRKQMAFAAAGLLLLFLIGGIFFEQMNRSNNEREKRLQEILSKNEQAFEDASAILTLNRSLAVEELNTIKQNVEQEFANFPENSSQYKTLQEFLTKVTDITNGGGGTAVNSTVLFEKNPVEQITFKGGQIVGVGNNTLYIISPEGTLEDSYDIGINGKVSANDSNAYVLSGGNITRINKSNGTDTEIIENLSGVKAFDVFGNNIYTLTNTILRFRPNNFDEENYLSEGISLDNPTSMSIDSSIWIIDSGKIRKFTKGEEENFSTSGDLPLSKSAIVYTDEEYANLYILDSEKKFIAIVDKTGAPVKNLELTKIPNVNSFAVSEEDSKIYLVSEEKIYSVDF